MLNCSNNSSKFSDITLNSNHVMTNKANTTNEIVDKNKISINSDDMNVSYSMLSMVDINFELNECKSLEKLFRELDIESDKCSTSSTQEKTPNYKNMEVNTKIIETKNELCQTDFSVLENDCVDLSIESSNYHTKLKSLDRLTEIVVEKSDIIESKSRLILEKMKYIIQNNTENYKNLQNSNKSSKYHEDFQNLSQVNLDLRQMNHQQMLTIDQLNQELSSKIFEYEELALQQELWSETENLCQQLKLELQQSRDKYQKLVMQSDSQIFELEEKYENLSEKYHQENSLRIYYENVVETYRNQLQEIQRQVLSCDFTEETNKSLDKCNLLLQTKALKSQEQTSINQGKLRNKNEEWRETHLKNYDHNQVEKFEVDWYLLARINQKYRECFEQIKEICCGESRRKII